MKQMKKLSLKRSLSVLLALAMMLSLLPSMSVAADTGDGVHFNFGAKAYGASSEIDMDTLKTYGDTSATIDASSGLTWANADGDAWVVDGHYRAQSGYPALTHDSVSTATKTPNALTWYAYGTRAWSSGAVKHDSATAIRLKIDETGTFVPTLTYHARPDLCIYEVYLVPYSKLIGNYQQRLKFANSALVSTVRPGITSYFIGNVDMYAETAGTKTSFLDDYVVETTGDYVLFFFSNGLNEKLAAKYKDANGPAIYVNLYSFDLNHKGTIARPEIGKLELTLSETTLSEGGSATSSVEMWLENGDIPTGEYEIEYKSSDDNIATVNKDGVVTAIAKGNATITATVKGTEVSDSVDIIVEGKPYLENIASAKPNFVFFENDENNSEASFGASAVLSNGKKGDISAYDVVYASADENIVSVDENGIMRAVSVGKTTVTASTTNENEENISKTVSVEVRRELDGLVYNFSASSYDLSGEIVKATLPTLGYAEYNTDPWQILSGANLQYWLSVTGNDKVTHSSGSNSLPNTLTWHSYGYRAARYMGATVDSENGTFTGGEYTARQDVTVAALIKINRTGTFTPAITYDARNTLCIFDTYLIPKSVVDATAYSNLETAANVAKMLGALSDKEKYLIAKHDMYNTIRETKTDSFANVTIENAGEYYLIWQTNGLNEVLRGPENFSVSNGSVNYKNHLYVNISNFGFYPLPKLPLASVEASASQKEVFEGDLFKITTTPKLSDGTAFNTPAVITELTSENEEIAEIDGANIKAKKQGNVRIVVKSHINGSDDIVETYVDIEILPEGINEIVATAGGSKYIRLTDKENDTVPLYVAALTNLGNEFDPEGLVFEAESLTPEIAEIIGENEILPISEGDAKFLITASHSGRTISREIILPVVRGKNRSSYLTKEKAEAAKENYNTYSWAKKEVDSSVKKADKYVEKLDQLYNMIHSEGVPRSTGVGAKSDPYAGYCRYCGVKITAEYGIYPWKHTSLSYEWKVQCPACDRRFPTNDFGKFYKLGLNEYGEFSRDRALAKHHALVHHGDAEAECECVAPENEWTTEWYPYYGYGAENGYLVNKLYANLENVKTLNVNQGLRPGETTATWGVDDGHGYVPRMPDGTSYKNDGRAERHTYIAEYSHYGLWRGDSGNGGAIANAISNLADAYFYTGEKKYGDAAAILIDRLADFYPDFDRSIWGNNVTHSDGGTGKGKILGNIWEGTQMNKYIIAYDMVFDCYDDPFVINYINEKAETIKMRHSKKTASQIRTNVEDGMLRTILNALPNQMIGGNFGYPQRTNALAAVVLDTMPDTKYWLDYLMAPGWNRNGKSDGGGIATRLVDEVDADGQGNEASEYNADWHTTLISVQEALDGYDGYQAASFYNNPKFVKMFYSDIPIITGNHSANIGDSFSTMTTSQWYEQNQLIQGFVRIGDPIFAQLLYLINGNESTGLHYNIYTKDPERLAKEVQKIIDEKGTLVRTSETMTNFGFAILRDGGEYTSTNSQTSTNNTRNAWMYFGSSDGHGHNDTMSLGMTAFGLEYLPDLGYPEQTSYHPNRLQWVGRTLSHNTVMVDEKDISSPDEPRGESLHFDFGEDVQVMDVSAPYVSESTEEYRRSVVMVHVDDENSYTVDFFRVLGGSNHLYSFHAASNEIYSTTGLDFTLIEDENGNYISGSQLDENGNYKGTYAGRDAKYIKDTESGAVRKYTEDAVLGANEVVLEAEYGNDPNSPNEWYYDTIFPRGYTWVKNVDRGTDPENRVEIDFAIKDFRKHLKDGRGLHLHMTVLNDTNVKKGADAEIAISDGYPPNKGANKAIDKFKYVFIKNEGKNLDTTFTTVLEPYRNVRYLKNSDEIEMRVVGDIAEKSGDASRAVRVEHKSGRVDYILYATNNKVTYEITLDDGSALKFRGFIGVWTVSNGANTYRYLHDGDILGEETGKAASIEGTVTAFTEDLAFKNFISITQDSEVSDDVIANLAGKYVFVDNGADVRSGAWQIKSAERSGRDIKLDVGDVTTVRKYKDEYDMDKGYIYIIEKNQPARIPLTEADDFKPIFDPVSENLSTSAGSQIKIGINASSPIEENAPAIIYEAETLPRGAIIDEETGEITWKPTSSQIGKNHFAVNAVDEYGRQETIHFYVEVFGSTAGGSTGGSGGGAGGGGSGGSSAPTTPSTPTIPATKPEETKPEVTPSVPTTPGTPAEPETDSNVRFIDLGAHAWAADAINALAEEGIIKGTSEKTFAPSANITRADFAILLVRAFKLESENTENFADVSASDYFAKELAVARNTGLTNGIGDNKFAPRNNITRQDMMVIVYRALAAMEKEFDTAAISAPDFANVSDYAKDAVSALVNAGLVNGKNGNVAPMDYTTRAEVAVLIKRILDFVK